MDKVERIQTIRNKGAIQELWVFFRKGTEEYRKKLALTNPEVLEVLDNRKAFLEKELEKLAKKNRASKIWQALLKLSLAGFIFAFIQAVALLFIYSNPPLYPLLAFIPLGISAVGAALTKDTPETKKEDRILYELDDIDILRNAYEYEKQLELEKAKQMAANNKNNKKKRSRYEASRFELFDSFWIK